MTEPAPARVIHVVPPGGGGVDRCVRDIVRQRPQDIVLHAAETQCVVEWPGPARYAPLALDDLCAAATTGALGVPLRLHAHGTVPSVRQACMRVAEATAAPVVLTLHDIWFADPDAGPDELQARLAFARAASLRTAPSRFIVDRAKQVLGEPWPCRLVPNGSDPFPSGPLPELTEASRTAIGTAGFTTAVIGAIGEHKGLSALERLASLLPDHHRVVVFGYTGNQLRQGWAVPGRLWVHGVFEPLDLPGLVQAYGSRLALFPPGMPESYCYALSDAWLSGLEVLAPDHGAIAERVREHGGGRLYPPAITDEALAGRVLAGLETAVRAEGPVALREPLPSVQAMIELMNEVYRASGPDSPTREPDDEALRRLAQTHLDARFMRREVIDLQRLIAGLEEQHNALQQRLEQSDHQRAQARAEAAHWQARHAALVARLLRPLRGLPSGLRDRLVRWGGKLFAPGPRR